jgi:hypothetical protein
MPTRAAGKGLSIDEANAFVPRLESLVSRLQRAGLQLQDEMVRLATETGRGRRRPTAEDLVRPVPRARAHRGARRHRARDRERAARI